MRNRIAIFQYDLPVTSYTKNLIIYLAKAGYNVDFFITYYSTRLNYVDIRELNNKNIKSYIQGDHPLKAMHIIYSISRKFRILISRTITDPKFIKNTKKVIKKNLSEYLCFIGIEKHGLICAGKISEETNIPFIYYSLELYIDDNPSYHSTRKIRKNEIFYHQNAKATIIQDKHRAEVLFKYNNISNSDSILFPISVNGSLIQGKKFYFHNKFDIPSDAKIALYFGWITEKRYCSSLAEISEKLGENYLVFHGIGEEKYLNTLRNNQNVIVSTDFVSEKETLDIISSAHIGIALYDNKFSNDRLTAFSSEKIALYMQAGLPIISFRNESYEELFENFKCGEMIETLEEFPEAFQRILQNYELYREECFKAFYRYYNFDENIKPVVKYIDGLKISI